MKMKICKNPIPEAFAEISQAVKDNEGYCPCLRHKTEDTKCMCKDFRDSTESDFCHCGRYYKINEYDWIALVGETSEIDEADNFNKWLDMLEKQNFIVVPIRFNQYNPFHFTESFGDMNRAKISEVEAIVLLDEHELSFALDIEAWAEALGKKIIHWGDLVK
jgi:hypothetical protein